jgi:hypothetical protein
VSGFGVRGREDGKVRSKLRLLCWDRMVGGAEHVFALMRIAGGGGVDHDSGSYSGTVQLVLYAGRRRV